MDESYAWLQQAISDRAAAERLSGDKNGAEWCHAVAKYQQTVEKAVKAIVAALHLSTGYQHDVGRFVDALRKLPRRARNRDFANYLSRLLDANTRTAIHSLDALAPKRPARGQLHQRKTEYPFQDPHGRWTFPAAQGVFSSNEVQQFRDLSYRIADGAKRVISAIRHAPR